jgi:Zn-dependent peptidase ImmA (M78 family)
MSGKVDVWAAVEEFRQKHKKDLGKIPIDVLTAIEVRLRLDVIPFPDLLVKYSADAAVMSDFSGIYVDEQSYEFLEGEPIWRFNRLRFSLAHELGHIILHRDLAGELKFKTLDDFRNWMQQYRASRHNLEWEANEFAGRLLVPVERLKADFDAFVGQIKTQFPTWWANNNLREALAGQLAEVYGVHKDVIACRLDREEFWPTP